MPPTLQERFTGCLLGLAVGDALGARFEGKSPEGIAQDFCQPNELINRPPYGQMWYTDDTQMMISVCETLVSQGAIDDETLCQRFAQNYEPHRGYGRSTQLIVEAMRAGHDYRQLAASLLPGGSFGNGAAMRVAPVGIAFRRNLMQVAAQARLSALPTHRHPLGIAGAQLLAAAVAVAAQASSIQADEFVDRLLPYAMHVEFAGPLGRVKALRNRRDLALFGNGVAAVDSVVTAIASFVLTPDDYGATISNVIVLGGDTDTLAAMAGAISGAYLGVKAIPPALLEKLEDGPKGRRFLEALAQQLGDRFAA